MRPDCCILSPFGSLWPAFHISLTFYRKYYLQYGYLKKLSYQSNCPSYGDKLLLSCNGGILI